MDWADWVTLLIPQWLLAVAAVAVFLQGVYAWQHNTMCMVSGWYFLAIGAGVLPVAAFYLIAVTVGYNEMAHAVAVSRLSFIILFATLSAVLQSVCKKDR